MSLVGVTVNVYVKCPVCGLPIALPDPEPPSACESCGAESKLANGFFWSAIQDSVDEVNEVDEGQSCGHSFWSAAPRVGVTVEAVRRRPRCLNPGCGAPIAESVLDSALKRRLHRVVCPTCGQSMALHAADGECEGAVRGLLGAPGRRTRTPDDPVRVFCSECFGLGLVDGGGREFDCPECERHNALDEARLDQASSLQVVEPRTVLVRGSDDSTTDSQPDGVAKVGADQRFPVDTTPTQVAVWGGVAGVAGGVTVLFSLSQALGMQAGEPARRVAIGFALVGFVGSIVGLLLHRWARGPQWGQRTIELRSDRVEFPRLGLAAAARVIEYAAIEGIHTHRRRGGQPEVTILFGGQSWTLETRLLGVRSDVLLQQLARRANVELVDRGTR